MTLSHYIVLGVLALTGLSASPDLKTLKTRFRTAETTQIRVDLLEEIAELHTGPTSNPAVLNAVVAAVEDEEHAVRLKAVGLLASHVDSDIALEGLVHAASLIDAQWGDDLDSLRARAAKLRARQFVELEATQALGAKNLMEALEHIKLLMDAEESYLAYRVALVEALTKRLDDRCVDGLAHIVPLVMYSDVAWSVMDGLFAIGTQPALAEAVTFLELDATFRKERSKQRKKLARQKPRKKPRYWKGTRDGWTHKEEGRLKAGLEGFDALTAKKQVWCEECAKRLRSFAKTKALATPPADTRWTTWGRWWRKARKSLPESLAG